MAKGNKLFEAFLSNIEPDKKAVRYAMNAHKPVRKYLENDEGFNDYFEDSFLYGSYPRHTATGDIKDVDIVIITNFDPKSEDNTPQKILRKLKSILAKYYKNPENPEYQRRSIRINEPLPSNADTEMTLDIIPAVRVGSDSDVLLVPDRELKDWVQTNPKGHIDYVDRLNAENYSKGTFVPLVKIMRWWWKYQCSVVQPKVERPKPKGFWIECLTAENFNPKADSWANHFIETLKNISDKYTGIAAVPALRDPGLPDQDIKTSMTQKEFKVFMTVVNDSLDIARQAYNESDEVKNSHLWQKIFGKEFPTISTKSGRQTASATSIMKRDTNEQFIEDFGIIEVITNYKLRIDALVMQDGFRPFTLRDAPNFLRKRRKLLFFIEKSKSNIPLDSVVYWKVKNKGEEAANIGQLRGEITIDEGEWSKDERTAYEGVHYVECYAVKDKQCIAKDRIEVPIGRL